MGFLGIFDGEGDYPLPKTRLDCVRSLKFVAQVEIDM